MWTSICRISSIWIQHWQNAIPTLPITRRQPKRQWKKWSASSQGLTSTGKVIRAGVIVRHLILPGHTRDSMAVLDYLKGTFGDQIYVSIMNQYTPLRHVAPYPEINRKVTRREYEKVLDYAIGIGMEQAFIQEGQTAEESFIPMFDCEGISRE